MKNFPFLKDGKTYWYSRAIVCVTAVFAKDKNLNTYILANRRGTATNKEVGKWNMPVGFLEFDETTAQCAVREVFEETGVKIDPKQVTLFNINSKPDDGSQDVGFRYYIVLPGTIDIYPTNTKHMERNEVLEAKWINIEEIDNYAWAWNHRDIILKIGTKVLGENIMRPQQLKEICYRFKCSDGAKIDIFGTSDKWGHTDYVDCATRSYECKDTPRNNFIRAYKDILKCFSSIKPIKLDKFLKEVIEEVKSEK